MNTVHQLKTIKKSTQAKVEAELAGPAACCASPLPGFPGPFFSQAFVSNCIRTTPTHMAPTAAH
jgi:hypothetical protein